MSDSLQNRPKRSDVQLQFSTGTLADFNNIKGEELSLETKDLTTISFMLPPSQISVKRQKSTPSETTLGGYVEYHWGDEVIIINASGVTYGFMTYDRTGLVFLSGRDGESDTSYSRAMLLNPIDRRKSLAYTRFQEVIDFYSNNGITIAANGLVSEAKDIIMRFDNELFIGRFEALSIQEDADKPHNFSYSFTFRGYHSVIFIG